MYLNSQDILQELEYCKSSLNTQLYYEQCPKKIQSQQHSKNLMEKNKQREAISKTRVSKLLFLKD